MSKCNIMKKELILAEIYRQNEHWNDQSEFFSDLKNISFKRRLFNQLLLFLERKQIISIVGLRRVGKTILLKQLIKEILKKNDVKNICFLTFDEAIFFNGATLADYLNAYLTEISPRNGRIYFFIDEIQYASKWQHIIKRYYDTNSRIKFVISGSSSLFLKKKTTESLAGRIFEFTLDVLSFEEYLELRKNDRAILEEHRDCSVEFLASPDILALESVEKIGRLLAQHGNYLRKEFENYLKYGQFPEIVGESDRNTTRKYLSESIYKKTIEYDIPKIFGAEKTEELKFLFQIMSNETGSLVNVENIAREIGLDAKTVQKYLGYFENSFLISFVYNFSKSFRKSGRSLKKVYLGSTNFFSVFHDYKNNELASQQLGLLAENYCFLLLRKNYDYVSFYNIRGREIDFMAANDLLDKKHRQYVEVKYRNNVSSSELKFVASTARKNNSPFRVFSKDTFKVKDDFAIIPIWLLKSVDNFGKVI